MSLPLASARLRPRIQFRSRTVSTDAIIGVSPLDLITRAKRWALPAGAAARGVTLLLAGISTVGIDAHHPRPTSILSGLNADTGKAVWTIYDAEPDAWTSQFLGSQPKLGLVEEYVPYLSRALLQSKAPAVDLLAPDAAVLEDAVGDGARTVPFTSPRRRE